MRADAPSCRSAGRDLRLRREEELPDNASDDEDPSGDEAESRRQRRARWRRQRA